MTNARFAGHREVPNPVTARAVGGVRARVRRSIWLAACEDVVLVWCVTTSRQHLTFLRERGLLADLVVVAVQIGDAAGYHHPLGVVPGTSADSVAGIDGWMAGRPVL